MINFLLRLLGRAPAKEHPEHEIVTQKLNEQERRLERIRASAQAIANRLDGHD